MNSIISLLLEKGIDIGTSLIPGGSLAKDYLKSIAKNLLGNENANEKEVLQAIQTANPQELEKIILLTQQLKTQNEIEIEKTNQSKEATNQGEISLKSKIINTFGDILDKHFFSFVIYMIILFIFCFIGIYFCETKMTVAENIDNYVWVEQSIIGLLILVLFAPISILYPPIGKVMNALSDAISHIITIPNRVLK